MLINNMKRKLYNMRWSETETNALIEARASQNEEFKKKNSLHHVIWGTIQSSRPELKYRTPQECAKKWNNLCDLYKRLKDPQTGTAPNKLNSANWLYFEKINDFMGDKQNIKPTNIIDSLSYPASNETSDDLIEYDSEIEYSEIEYVSQSEYNTEPNTREEASLSSPISGTSQNALESSTKKKTKSQRQKKDIIFDYIQKRDETITKAIKKNNKLIKNVCQKYFPEVELSSDSD